MNVHDKVLGDHSPWESWPVNIPLLSFAHKKKMGANFLFCFSEFNSTAWDQLPLFYFDINRFKPRPIIYWLNDVE